MSNSIKTAGKKKHVSISHIFNYIILSLWAVTTIFPFYWILVNSVKDSRVIYTNSFSLPKEFVFENYSTAWTAGADGINVLIAYKNSIIISAIVTIAVILFAGMASFALTRYKFKGRNIINSLVIGSLMFPVFSTIIPVYKLVLNMGLLNNLAAVILPQIAGNLAFAMVVLTGYLHSSPIELEESAFLEGCNAFQVFYKIIVPIAKPAFATVAIFTFLWSYNDLFTQLFMLRDVDQWTVNLMLNNIGNAKSPPKFGIQCALIVMIVIPVLIVYIFLQKNIIKGLTAGAIKG